MQFGTQQIFLPLFLEGTIIKRSVRAEVAMMGARRALVWVVFAVVACGCTTREECSCGADGWCRSKSRAVDGAEGATVDAAGVEAAGENVWADAPSWPDGSGSGDSWEIGAAGEGQAPDGSTQQDGPPSPDLWPPDVGPGPNDVAGCEQGTPCAPIEIPSLPFHDERNGAAGPSDQFDSYSPCAPWIDESGPEYVYVLDVPGPAVLHAAINEVEGDGVDMDVHILSAPSADACIARAHAHAAAWVGQGTYWIAVDTWVDDGGTPYPGPYALDVFATGADAPGDTGFNKFVAASLNDWEKFPKDGTYEYCFSDETCEPDVPIYFGMVHDGWYMGQYLFEGTGLCYCCGHTLEIFLDAFRRFQEENNLPETFGFGGLTVDDMDKGAFYQHWFGWGVADTSSSANALEYSGIGIEIPPESWEQAQLGDFVNLSRTNGTGHSVIFVSWVYDEGEIAGLRYYSCNGSGESTADPADPSNVSGVSGPSFQTEYFDAFGGKVMPEYVFVGHAFDPLSL